MTATIDPDRPTRVTVTLQHPSSVEVHDISNDDRDLVQLRLGDTTSHVAVLAQLDELVDLGRQLLGGLEAVLEARETMAVPA